MLLEIESSANQPSSEQKQQGRDFGDRDRWGQVSDVVSELRYSNARKDANHLLGLPAETPWEQITEYMATQDRIYYAQQYGLPEDSPIETIDAHMRNNNQWVREQAAKLGLPPDASKSEVHEAERQKRANEAGLPEDTSWQDVFRAEHKVRRERTLTALGLDPQKEWDWEAILRRALCLPSDASTEDFVQHIAEVRTWQIERLVQQIEAGKPLK